MRTFWFILGFLIAQRACKASDGSFGTLEASRYFASNVPAYRDLQGGDAKYHLDLTLNFLIAGPLRLALGLDALTGPEYFTQGSGHCELILALNPSLEIFAYHRSEHAFDRSVDLSGPRFLSDNRLGARYSFAIGGGSN